MLVVHATKKLRDRVKALPIQTSETSTTRLGDWYATAVFWRPQVCLFVNELTLLPVLLPLAPTATLDKRFPAALGDVLAAHNTDVGFIAAELAEMGQLRLAKTVQPQRGRHDERVHLPGRGPPGHRHPARFARAVCPAGRDTMRAAVQAPRVPQPGTRRPAFPIASGTSEWRTPSIWTL